MLMRYLDLAPYMIGAKTDPKVLNIGWLDGANDYIKGQLDLNLVLKLLTLTLFNLDQRPINKPSGRHEHAQNIIVHTMHMIGSPVSCPYCQKPIQLIDDQSRVMYLGKNEMRLPNADRSVTFSFPTLLYHYMVEHYYLPPSDFIDALAAFDLGKSYDCKRQSF